MLLQRQFNTVFLLLQSLHPHREKTLSCSNAFPRHFLKLFFKKFSAVLFLLAAGIGIALAQVDVNLADQAGLGSVKGVGPAISKRILDACKQDGAFKSRDDLEERVTGISPKSAARLSAGGLTMGSKTKPGAMMRTKPAGKPDAAKTVSAKPVAAKTKSAG